VPHLERFVTNDGLKIRYLDNQPEEPSGQPDEPLGLPVVFVPGVTDFADEYEAVLDVFAPRRLLVIEMRGRGGSDSPADGYTVAEQASDVEAVIGANGLSRFHLMTFSRGTTPSLEVALRKPPRAVTISIGDYLPMEIGLGEDWVDFQWSSRWRGREMPDRVERHVIEGIQSGSVHRDLSEEVAALGIPVLVARGGDGGVVNDEIAARYLASIPGVEMVVIPGAGHDLFRPDRVAYPRAVIDFISRRAPGT
jgi:pimeloyl-ACP methyl ester carboxylesterase